MTKEIVEYNQLKNEEWFDNLVEECKAIVTQRRLRASLEIIEGKWDLGKRIIKDSNYEKHLKGSGKIVDGLAKDIGISNSDLYDCLKFYERFEVFDKALEEFGNNVTWFQIRQKYLGKRNEKAGTPRVCYRIEGILESFRDWFNSSKATQVEEAIEEFKNKLIKLRK